MTTIASLPFIININRSHTSRASRNKFIKRSARSPYTTFSLLIRPLSQIIKPSLSPIHAKRHNRNRRLNLNLIRRKYSLQRNNHRLITSFIPNIVSNINIKLNRSHTRRHNSRILIKLKSRHRRIANRISPTTLITNAKRTPIRNFSRTNILVKSSRLRSKRTTILRINRRLTPRHLILAVTSVRTRSLPTTILNSPNDSRSDLKSGLSTNNLTRIRMNHIRRSMQRSNVTRNTNPGHPSAIVRIHTSPQSLTLKRPNPTRHNSRIVSATNKSPVRMNLRRSHIRYLISPTAQLRSLKRRQTLTRLQSHRPSVTNLNHRNPQPQTITFHTPNLNTLMPTNTSRLYNFRISRLLRNSLGHLASRIRTLPNTRRLRRLQRNELEGNRQ